MIQKFQKSPTRKKFLLWSSIVLCSATFLKFLPGANKKKSGTVKMLAQDGTLVEIDKELLFTSRKKISDKELQQWIKK